MSTWNDIIFPAHIAALPKNERGVPIPFFAAKKQKGEGYDLRFADPLKQRACAKKRVCWVCGKPLGFSSAFIGGPLSAKSRQFSDGPMHMECAVFSLEHCPFLATPNYHYSEHNIPANVTPDQAIIGKPEYHTLTLTDNWKATDHGEPTGIIFTAIDPFDQTVWKGGKELGDFTL